MALTREALHSDCLRSSDVYRGNQHLPALASPCLERTGSSSEIVLRKRPGRQRFRVRQKHSIAELEQWRPGRQGHV